MKNHTIIGMAGHIDHGKTAIIRALTGIETDRLKEEQERKITIDIGFAYWKKNVTIIDVPGHEKFIRNMVAGVNAVDLFLLVIAADDGIMPQTLEHLDILKFFNIKDGVIALNKTDLVDHEWLSMVKVEISELIEAYGLNNIPIIPVSAVKSEGIEQLNKAIADKISALSYKPVQQPFRLNVDRSFSAHGFGTVVTGAVLSDKIIVEQRVTILPDNKTVKVRGIEVHQTQTNEAVQGQRAAINLAGINAEEICRGKVLTAPGSLESCRELLAVIRTSKYLKLSPKKFGQVRIHLGTSELTGNINWFEEDKRWQADQEYHVHIKLSEQGVAVPGDPVLIRNISPVHTLAGGKILLTNPPGIKNKDNLKAWFSKLSSDVVADKILCLMEMRGLKTASLSDLQKNFFLDEDLLSNEIDNLVERKLVIMNPVNNEQVLFLGKNLEQAMALIRDKILSKKEAGGEGYSLNELKQSFVPKFMDEHYLTLALKDCVGKGILFEKDQNYYLDDPAKNEKEINNLNKIANKYLDCRFTAPALEELAAELAMNPADIKRITGKLAQDGKLISIGGKYYLHHQVFTELIQFLRDYFVQYKEIDISRLKEYTGSTRKYLIPLLEYLDRQRYTDRTGDLRKKGISLES
ncbi:MAG: selenocysteine-specific translation elongation factor [Calditrichaceae bacterium]|nr:selenocysteine-specific translation elongation factor [Calditrichaceae bacterium]MBN2708776.1 selenocysteine-specific translation elongation factor [Calditrichaceae bacterium]RQV97693.1 MAG: selenocysteine-specific translation elongation factor [Calditrichota bacterium]